MTAHPGQQVKVWINSIIGSVPARVVRDLTGDPMTAAQCNAMEGERVYEVRWTAGPHRGAYTNCPARDLRPASPDFMNDPVGFDRHLKTI